MVIFILLCHRNYHALPFFIDFKTLHGFYMVGSLFVLPLWYYITIYTPGLIAAWCDQSVQSVIYTALIAGRALAALAEVSFIYLIQTITYPYLSNSHCLKHTKQSCARYSLCLHDWCRRSPRFVSHLGLISWLIDPAQSRHLSIEAL